MKGLVFHGKHDIRYESVDDPKIEEDRDVIVKTLACGICGSDLHLYHENLPAVMGERAASFCVGHEAGGEVVETGREVVTLKVGDSVILPASVGCGRCQPCLRGDIKKCRNNGLSVFGFGTGLGGCQADAIRVPAADVNAWRLPEGVSVDQGIALTDNLPTAFAAVLSADIKPGATVAVIGLGPIGLMAVELVMLMGASRVFAIDLVEGRRLRAAELGATALDSAVAVETIREATAGFMLDSIVEAVGSDRTMELAFDLAGVGGKISVLGVNGSMQYRTPFLSMVKGVTVAGNFFTEVAKYWKDLIPLIQAGRLHPERFITDRVPLSEGVKAYEKFDRREGGTLKAVLYPGM